MKDKPFKVWCSHFNGRIEHDACEAGVRYDSLKRENGLLPCTSIEACHLCPLFQPKTVLAAPPPVIDDLKALLAEVSATRACPRCGEKLRKLVKVGRVAAVYGWPCGCRLWQRWEAVS